MKSWKLLFLFLLSSPLAAESGIGAQLQTTILAEPVHGSRGDPGKIKPGSQVQLIATVKNVGDQTNAAGTLFIRFVFPEPMEKEPRSLIFETEKVKLPSIEPGETFTISFRTPHKWPSLFDYIRNDWAMREYEAIITIEGTQEVTGTRAISFSAYYYGGPSREKPNRFPTAGRTTIEQEGTALSPRLLPPQRSL